MRRNKLTPVKALEITIEFWDALSLEPNRSKRDCSKYNLVKGFDNNCPLCEQSKIPNSPGFVCERCLLYDFFVSNQHDYEPGSGICRSSIFGRWVDSEELVDRSKYAMMISDAARAKLEEIKNEQNTK